MHIGKKTLLMTTGVLCSLSLVAAVALAISKDEWKPANTAFTATAINSSFTAAGATATCEVFALKGTTPKGSGGIFSETEAQAGVSVTPKVEKCKPAATEVFGPWKLALHSKGCAGEKEEEDDCVTVTIPNEGAVIKFPLCTSVKVNAQSITETYKDDPGEGLVEFKEKPVTVKTNCAGEQKAKFTGTFKVAPLITDDE